MFRAIVTDMSIGMQESETTALVVGLKGLYTEGYDVTLGECSLEFKALNPSALINWYREFEEKYSRGEYTYITIE